jgi:F420H(2)-dependent quinone reductase
MEVTAMDKETMTRGSSGGEGEARSAEAPSFPVEFALLGVAHRLVHRLSGGRMGKLDRAEQTPTGATLRLITALHRRLYLWSGGRLGTRIIGLPNLLLTTTGRKTGLPRTVPLPYLPHPEGVMVVASFAGNPQNPAWYENLVARPDVEVQIGPRRYRARATPASPAERPALWSRVLARAPFYGDYEKLTTRVIPIVVLREETNHG